MGALSMVASAPKAAGRVLQWLVAACLTPAIQATTSCEQQQYMSHTLTSSLPQLPLETLLGRDGGQQEQQMDRRGKEGPLTTPLPKSQVLGKVKDFLGEIGKANEKLHIDAQSNPPEDYDIEVLTGNEKEYIQMDLLLGVADLHSEQAVEAAEATMSSFPPSARPFTGSSSSSEDDSDDSEGDDSDDPDMSQKEDYKYSDQPENGSQKETKSNKRQKIVVLG